MEVLTLCDHPSGSQTMAYVMALQQGWPTNELQFKGRCPCDHLAIDYVNSLVPFGMHAVNNDIRGLIDSVNDGSTSAFMWEWFTTKPFVDAGECRFVRPLTSRSL